MTTTMSTAVPTEAAPVTKVGYFTTVVPRCARSLVPPAVSHRIEVGGQFNPTTSTLLLSLFSEAVEVHGEW